MYHPLLNRGRTAGIALLCALLLTLTACSGDDDGPTGPTMRLNNPAAAPLEVGGSVQLTVLQATGDVTWSSSNTAVATVVSTGFVTAVGPGTATITASTPSQSASTTITVQAPPSIGFDAGALSFTAPQGGANPPPQLVNVLNAGPGTLGNIAVNTITYGAGQPTGWLSATLAAISATAAAPAGLQVTASVVGLQEGAYSANIVIQASPADNSPRSLPVTLTVSPPPDIELSRDSVVMTAVSGVSPPVVEAVVVSTMAASPITGLTRVIVYDQPAQTGWLTAELLSTSTAATLRLTANAGSRPAGTYTATVSVLSPNAGNSPQTVRVTFTVQPPPVIVVDNTSLSFTAEVGGANPPEQRIRITNGGGGGNLRLRTRVIYQQAAQFLNLDFAPPQTPDSTRVRPVVGSLPAGTYTARYEFESTDFDIPIATVNVTFTIGNAPSIALSSSTVNFAAGVGGVAPSAMIMVSNGSAAPVTGLSTTVQYLSGNNWLSASLNGTSAPATLTLQSSIATLTPGTYQAIVRVSSPVAANSPSEITVTLVVSAAPTIVVSTIPFDFSGTTTTAPAAQQRQVTNGGGGTLSGLSVSVQYAGSSGWLNATLNSNTAPATLTLQPLSGLLPPNSYSATVRISSNAGLIAPVTIPVSYTVVLPPAIGLSTSSSTLSRASGNGTVNTNVTVTNSGGGSLTGLAASVISSSAPGGAIAASINSGSAPATVTISGNTGSSGAPLTPGSYTATVRVSSATAGIASRDITVAFSVLVSLSNNIYSQVYPTYCSGCHFSGGSAPDLSTVSRFRSNMVNVSTNRRPPAFPQYPLALTFNRLIVPGNATQSYLIYQLAKSTGAFPMPTSIGSSVPISLRALISTWINQGAQNN